ncbi:MAG: JAB domain-containing protein [Bacteroidetes bacterium]|nr:MAG: JAB domain-containing protein [Bacteroidota bacterium]
MEPYQPIKGIRSWAEDDRPREKLLLKGKAALSDAELIAILIGSGSADETAVDLSKRILQSLNNQLSELGKLSVKDLTKFKGIGEAKAISIIAALELGRRRKDSEPEKRIRITDSRSAFDVIYPHLSDLLHEEFWVIYLNRANAVIGKENISKGGISGTTVDPKVVFRMAVQIPASAIILAHNHPSGQLKPSQADHQLTRKLKEAGAALDIPVLDHLIIGERDYFSFVDEGVF